MRAFAMCPQMIPGMEPSGTSTEQIRDETASAENRSGVCCGRPAAAEAGGAGREAGREIGGGGGALLVATSAGAGFMTGAEAAAGTVIDFWQAGQLILAPL